MTGGECHQVTNNLKSEPLVHFLPTSERQCRLIAKFAPQKQGEIWSAAVKKAGNKVPPARIVREVVNQIEGKPQMESKPKKDGIVRVPGIGIEYVAHLDKSTYWMLKDYQQQVGAATFNGAIRRLLDEQNQRNGQNEN